MAQKIKYPVVNGKKQCGICGEWKDISEYNKARNHYSSQCKSCLKIKAAEYRSRPEIKIKTSEYHKQYMKDPEKRAKRNAYNRKRNKREDVKEKRNKQRREWALKEKLKAMKYKGGKCVICGYNKCTSAMDFHHLDPNEKEKYAAHWTFEKNKYELDKCILVCCRCHRELHAGVIIYEEET